MDLAHSLGAKGSGGEGLFKLGLIKLYHESFDGCSSKMNVELRHHFFIREACPQRSRHLLFGGKFVVREMKENLICIPLISIIIGFPDYKREENDLDSPLCLILGSSR